MNVDFTRPSLFRSIFYFLPLYIGFRCKALLLTEQILTTDTMMMPVQEWLTGFFVNHHVWREVVLFLLVLITAFSITRILSRNLIYLERTYISLIIYPLLALGYTTSAMTPVILICAFLIVYAVENMIQAHKQEISYGCFLNASVALGITPLLYAPTAVFFFLLPVGFLIFRQNWRSGIASLIGYTIPLFFNAYVLWGMGGDFGAVYQRLSDVLLTSGSETLFIFRMEVWDYVLTAIFIGLTIFSFIHFYNGQTKIRRRAFRGYSTFVWVLICTVGMFALPCRSTDMLPLLAVSLSALLPACFNRKSGWFPNLLYLTMLWSVLIYNIHILFVTLSV